MPTGALEELVEDGALLAAVPVDPVEEFEGRVPPCEDAEDWEVWVEDEPEAEVEADVVEGADVVRKANDRKENFKRTSGGTHVVQNPIDRATILHPGTRRIST